VTLVCPFCQADDHPLCDWSIGCECPCGLGLDLPWIPTPREST
jgi:hypothetical protein